MNHPAAETPFVTAEWWRHYGWALGISLLIPLVVTVVSRRWRKAVQQRSKKTEDDAEGRRLRRVTTVVGILSGTIIACSSAKVAPRNPDRTAPARLAAADGLVRAGCFDCLVEANREYLAQLATQLEALGIQDAYVKQLYAQIDAGGA